MDAATTRPLFDLNVAGEEEPEEAPPPEPEMKVEECHEEVEEDHKEVDEDPEEVEEVELQEVEEVEVQEVEEVEVGEEPRRRRRKRKEFEVFVGGLPRDAVEGDIKMALAAAGEVEEVRLVRAAGTGLNKGFAFVRFAFVEQACLAAAELRRVVIKGKSCGIFRNIENETLHIRNICPVWSKDDLIDNLKIFELENLEEIHLIEHPDRKGTNRGYAFLDFSTHMDAVAAFLRLQKSDVYLGTNVRARVSFSKTIAQDNEVMAEVKSVFVDGLPATWDEDKVRQMFKKFGEIDNIQLARNMFSAKRRDFGFVSFTTRQAAMDCIEMVNKDGVGEGLEKVLMKATFQRPRPAYKKPSWKQAAPVLGIKRGFIGKNHDGRGLHPSRLSHAFLERPTRSHKLTHKGYNVRPMANRLPSKAPDAEGMPLSEGMSLSVHEYRAYYRRDCAVEMPVSSSRHRQAHPEGKFREVYQERRYAYVHPKGRHTDVYPQSMQRDMYREIRHRDEYIERAHRDSCPECSSSDHDVGVYQDFPLAYSHPIGRRSNTNIPDPCYEYQQAEEFPAMCGREHSYYEIGHELKPWNSAMHGYEQSCHDIDQKSMASTSQSEHERSRSGLQMPVYPKHSAAPSDQHYRYLPDDHPGYEMEYTVGGHRGWHLSTSGGHRTYRRL